MKLRNIIKNKAIPFFLLISLNLSCIQDIIKQSPAIKKTISNIDRVDFTPERIEELEGVVYKHQYIKYCDTKKEVEACKKHNSKEVVKLAIDIVRYVKETHKKYIGIEDLLTLFYIESKFNIYAINKKTNTIGLIQIIGKNRKEDTIYNTCYRDYYDFYAERCSIKHYLDLLFKKSVFKEMKTIPLLVLYLGILYPKAIGKPLSYPIGGSKTASLNPKLSIKRKGKKITVKSVNASVISEKTLLFPKN